MADGLLGGFLDSVLCKVEIVLGAPYKVSFQASCDSKEFGQISALFIESKAVRIEAIEAEGIFGFIDIKGIAPWYVLLHVCERELRWLAWLVGFGDRELP